MKKITVILFFLTFMLISQGNLVSSEGLNYSINKASVSNYDGFDLTISDNGLVYNFENVSSINDVYRVVSTTDLTIVSIIFNLTGTTVFTASSVSSTNAPEKTIGDLFLIVDNDVSKVSGVGSIHSNVYDLTITLTQGKHVITLAYLGKDDTEGFVYTHDTIRVEISNTNDFSDWQYKTTTVGMNIVDSYVVGKEISGQLAYYSQGWDDWFPNNTFPKEISLDDYTIDGDDNLNIDISMNSTGSDAFQSSTSYFGTEGHLFYFDSEGLHKYNDAEFDVVFCDELGNNIGLVLFREAGIFSKSWYPYNDCDWEGLDDLSNFPSDVIASFDFSPEVLTLPFSLDGDVITSDTASDTTSDITDEPTETTPVLDLPFPGLYLLGGFIVIAIIRRKNK
jgi:hypothetical protein